MGAPVRHTACMGRQRHQISAQRPHWRVVESREARDRRLGKRRTELTDERTVGVIFIGTGVCWVVLSTALFLFVPDASGGDVTAFGFWWLVGVGCLVAGTMWVRSAVRQLRPVEERVWLDDRDLWCAAASEAEPRRVTRADIVEVGLGPGDATVVVRTVDGREETVSGLGTHERRIEVAAEIGDAIAPGVGRVHPELPPDLPRRWRHARSLVWRRPNPVRRWSVVALAVVVTAGAPVALPYVVLAPLVVLPFVAFVGYSRWIRGVFQPIGTGWRVVVGGLAGVEIRTRTGDETHPGTARRVVGLELTRHALTGRTRLHAVYDDRHRQMIMAGRRRVDRFARWLAQRSDLPLGGA